MTRYVGKFTPIARVDVVPFIDDQIRKKEEGKYRWLKLLHSWNLARFDDDQPAREPRCGMRHRSWWHLKEWIKSKQIKESLTFESFVMDSILKGEKLLVLSGARNVGMWKARVIWLRASPQSLCRLLCALFDGAKLNNEIRLEKLRLKELTTKVGFPLE